MAMTAYLTVEEARALGASLPGFAALLALADAARAQALLLATVDVDADGPYQGRKVVVADGGQELEFPRVPYSLSAFPLPTDPQNPTLYTKIWDLDPVTGTAVVPQKVKMACLIQAAWLSNAALQARREDILSGLSQQQIATAREAYVTPEEIQSTGGLCDRSRRIMSQYLLVSGKLT